MAGSRLVLSVGKFLPLSSAEMGIIGSNHLFATMYAPHTTVASSDLKFDPHSHRCDQNIQDRLLYADYSAVGK